MNPNCATTLTPGERSSAEVVVLMYLQDRFMAVRWKPEDVETQLRFGDWTRLTTGVWMEIPPAPTKDSNAS